MFTNSKNSKTSDFHRLLLNLSDEMNLKIIDKYAAISNINIYYTQKNNKLKYLLQREMKSLNYLVDYFLYQIFKIILSTSSKNMKQCLIILQ